MRSIGGVLAASALCAALAVSSAAVGADAKPEKADVKIAVGGKSFMIYLPLTLTERLGYFKEAGLDVEILDLAATQRTSRR